MYTCTQKIANICDCSSSPPFRWRHDFSSTIFCIHNVHDKLYCSMNNYCWKCRHFRNVLCHSIKLNRSSKIMNVNRWDIHGWPSTQPGTCRQPCPNRAPLFTQPCPIVHTAAPWENNEHGCVYLRCRTVCKLPGCVEGHPWYCINNISGVGYIITFFIISYLNKYKSIISANQLSMRHVNRRVK